MMKTELVLLIIAMAFALTMICYIIRTGRKEATQDFEKQYKVVARFIRDCPKAEEYRLKAKLDIIRLKKMPCADKEKLDVLRAEIIRKFGNEN